ncbi:cell division protein ZapB [Nesterenkonia sp. CL21]|uniref:cell division protein ZapB n=1 Tax=Nesterenkonia sp. CL21 TaxID=3064894 RepID=UPI00287A394B|nr:cell division protein ZapB [Nesterenkonia sp. CL21]MDS2171639.1 cell division protein ZapB [Nesterenkonia sp. CL21]
MSKNEKTLAQRRESGEGVEAVEQELDNFVEHNLKAWLRPRVARIGELLDENRELRMEIDEARAEAEELREGSRILREAMEDAAPHRDELRADLERALAAQAPDTTVPRVITPDELRDGQTVAVKDAAGSWRALRSKGSALVTDSGAMALTVGMARRIVLLADAPVPDPEPEPWRPKTGDVGIVTHFQGDVLDGPVAAWFDGEFWVRVDSRDWPDGAGAAYPHEVTVVRAKVVPDEFHDWMERTADEIARCAAKDLITVSVRHGELLLLGEDLTRKQAVVHLKEHFGDSDLPWNASLELWLNDGNFTPRALGAVWRKNKPTGGRWGLTGEEE